MKIAVVSPHSGDAAFALGLAIEAWLVQGHAVEVVNCFTRSEFAPYSDAGSLHANDRMSFVTAVRKREDEAWRKLYGAAKLTLTDLNLKDAPIRLHCGPNEVFGRVSDASEKVVAKIRGALERSGAGAVVLPLGLGGHVDHVSARDVAMATDIRTSPLAFYEEFPDVERLEGEEAFAAALSQVAMTLQMELEPVFVSSTDRHASAIEEAVLRKRRVAWSYDSQIDEKVTTQIAEGCRRYEGRERLWGNTAWRADALLMPKVI